MMIHKYKNIIGEPKQNPFMGEEWLVFANGGGAEGQGGGDDESSTSDQETAGTAASAEAQKPADGQASEAPMPQADVDKWLAPNYERANKHESALVRDIKELVPGQRAYTPESRGEIEHSWGQMMTEYNGVQSYVDHFTNLRTYVLSQEFDPNEERWRAHGVAKIYSSFDAINSVKGLKLSNATKRRLRNKQNEETNASKDEIARDLADVIVGLEKARGEMLDTIEEQMRLDFTARLKYLDQQWAENPPPQYDKKQVLEKRRRIREMKGEVGKGLLNFFEDEDDHIERMREYRAIHNVIAEQEGQFETNHQDGHEMETINVGDLSGQYADLVKLKKAKIDSIASAYASKVDLRVSELNTLISEIAVSNLYDGEGEENRQEEIKNLRKTVANLKKNRDIGKIMSDTLDNNDPMRQKKTNEAGEEVEGDPILINFEDGSSYETKKGLKQQIAFLDDPRLKPEERRMFAVGLREAMQQFEKDVVNTISYFENDLDAIHEKIEIQRQGMNAPEPRQKQFELYWFSPYDAVRAFEIVQEWSKRRYQRSATQRVGIFGSKLLDPLGSKYNPISPLRTLPNEFDKEVERAEQEEVNQYKEIYANKDMWQVEDNAWKTRNKDEFKACLYLLAENGRLRWDTDKMLSQIMYFQTQVTFSDAQTEIQDISRFYENLQKALGAMWDFDTFNQMKNQNSSAYNSKKQEYQENCNEWAESAGGLEKVIDGLLKSHKERGREAKVDPLLYEEIIDYAITQGKMDPEKPLYYLIQGIAVGLLAPDRGSVINSTKINDYPAIDWFGSPTARGPKPTLEDVQEKAQYDKESFFHFFHTDVMTQSRVAERVNKTLTQGNKLDHDYMTSMLGYMNETTTETMLGKHADGFRLPQTGVQNGTVSMLLYMDSIAENFDTIPDSGDALVRFIGSFTRYDAILMNRMYRDQGSNFFRWDNSSYNANPRYAGGYQFMYGRGPMTAKEHMGEVREYLKLLDPEFFDAIYDYDRREMTNDKAADIANSLVKRYGTNAVFDGDVPETVDELYKSVGTFAKYIVEHQPGKLQAMFDAVKKDHNNKDAIKFKKNVGDAQERIETMRKSRRSKSPIYPASGVRESVPTGPTANNSWHIS